MSLTQKIEEKKSKTKLNLSCSNNRKKNETNGSLGSLELSRVPVGDSYHRILTRSSFDQLKLSFLFWITRTQSNLITLKLHSIQSGPDCPGSSRAQHLGKCCLIELKVDQQVENFPLTMSIRHMR